MNRALRSLAVGLLAGLAGCSVLAKTTPTPAARLDRKELEVPPKPANERYYVIIFGSQRVLYLQPGYTHTWATAVKATWTDGCTEPELQVDTISWLPASLDVDPTRYRIEPGINMTLEQTLDFVLDSGERVVMWGPYEMQTGPYRRALIHKAFLESGVVGYQCVDTIGESARTGLGCDCIHAISDMDPQFDRFRYPLIFYGHPASRRLVHEAARRQVLIDEHVEHDWLIGRLGLDRYPIERRAQPYQGIRRPIDPDRPRTIPRPTGR
jgi:hypothetical protein